jgi:biopolymer transport protein ExbD
MTSMIDVVFLLLVFFAVAFEPDDVLAKLKVDRPGKGPTPPVDVHFVKVEVLQHRYLLNGRGIGFEELAEKFGRLEERKISPPIVITCHPNSQHGRLIKILNLCEKTKITRIMVMSAGPR